MSRTIFLTSFMKPYKELFRPSWDRLEGMILSRQDDDTFLLVQSTMLSGREYHIPCILSGAEHVTSKSVQSDCTTHVFKVTNEDRVELYLAESYPNEDPCRIQYVEMDSMSTAATLYEMDPVHDLSAWEAAVEQISDYEEVTL